MLNRMRVVSCLFVLGCLFVASAVLADRITLKDGTVLDGTAIKEKGGYWFKSASGERRHILDDDIAKVEKGSFPSSGGGTPGVGGPSVPRFRVGSLASTKQRADDVDTAVAAVTIWQQFIDSKPSPEDLKIAKEEMAKWKKLQDEHAEKIRGRWVGGAEHKALIEKFRKLYREGYDLMQKDETLPAIKKLQEAQLLYPNSFESNFWLGWLMMIQRDKDKADKAIGYFNEALRLRPNTPECLSNIGICQLDKKQFQDAIMTQYKAIQHGDTKEIAQNLVTTLNLLPPMLQRTEKLKPVIEASHVMELKYGVGPGPLYYVRLEEKSEKKKGGGEGDDEGHIPGSYYSGTGFIIAADGLILTNRHVVEGAKTCMVMLDGKIQKSGEIVKIDDEQDLAMVKVKPDDGQKLPVLKLANTDSPNAGADCTVMGFPLIDRLGANIKITRGVVTDNKADFGVGPDIVIDAKVNPGNSGGPILDKYGNVMAIVSMKTLSSTSEDTYGLGISAGHIRKFLDKNNVKVSKGEPLKAALATEDVVAKAKPAAVCIIVTR